MFPGEALSKVGSHARWHGVGPLLLNSHKVDSAVA